MNSNNYIYLYVSMILGLMQGCSLFDCENTKLHEQFLGESGHKLVVMEVGCGATSQNSIHLSIIENNQVFNEEMRGNFFVTNDQLFDYERDIIWDSTNSRITLIERDTNKTFKRSLFVDVVNVEYIKDHSLYKLPNDIVTKVDSLFERWVEIANPQNELGCKSYLVKPEISDKEQNFNISFGYNCPFNFLTLHTFKYIQKTDELYVYSSKTEEYIKVNLDVEFNRYDSKYEFENLNSFLLKIQKGDFYATSGHYTGSKKYITTNDLNIGTYYAIDLEDENIRYSVNVGFENDFSNWRVEQSDQMILEVILDYPGIKLWNDLEVGLSIDEFSHLNLIDIGNNVFRLIEAIDILSDSYKESIIRVDSDNKITSIVVRRI